MVTEDDVIDDVIDECNGITWLEKIDELITLAGHVAYQYVIAEEFCDGVIATLKSIEQKITTHGEPTLGQERAIKNIERGLRKWRLK